MLGLGLTWVNVEPVGSWYSRLRSQSYQIDQLLRGDFSSLATELSTAYPETKGLVESPIDLVRLYVDQLSGRYTRPLTRVFATTDAAALAALYREAQIDAAMACAERATLAHQSVLLLPMQGRPVRWLVIPPWQAEVTPGPAWAADDIQSAAKVKIQIPASADETVVTYETATITSTEGYIERGGTKVPLWGSSPAHPWPGQIPLVSVRLAGVQPAPGRFWAPIDEPLLKLAIALSLDESDIRLIAHHQSWGQRYISGIESKELVEEMTVGPDKMLLLQRVNGDGAPPTVGVVSSQPPLGELANWRESRIRFFCAARGVAADAILRHNTSATMSAREMTRIERASIMARQDSVWRQAEREVAAWTVRVANLRRVEVFAEPAEVQIHWAEGEGYGSSSERASARKMDVEQGFTSIARELARAEGISIPMAIERVKTIRAENEAVKPEPPAPPPAPPARVEEPDEDDDETEAPEAEA